MSYSIDTFEQDLEGMLHGTTLNQITNLVGLENRAARQLLLDLDPQETKRTVQFVNPIFNSVFDYPLADDVKGNKLIDIFPQVQRLPQDIWSQAYNQAFDVAKQNIFSLANMFTMNFNTGLKTIRLNCPFLNPPVIIDYLQSANDNGTWSAGGSASDLTENNQNYVAGGGALQFNFSDDVGGLDTASVIAPGTGYSNGDYSVTGGGQEATVNIATLAGAVTSVTMVQPGFDYEVGDILTIVGGGNNATITVTAITPVGYLINTTLNPIDLSNVVNQSSLFINLSFQDGSAVEGTELRFGSSVTNYYKLTASLNQQGNAFVNGWNLIEFPWEDAEVVGSPDSSEISYAQIFVSNGQVQTGCLANLLTSILGTVLNYSYYSKFLFRDATTGAFQETVTDTTNLINLDTESYNLFTYLAAYYASQQQQDRESLSYDSKFFKDEYDKGVIRYKAMYKSELQKPQSNYYAMPTTNYNRYGPGPLW